MAAILYTWNNAQISSLFDQLFPLLSYIYIYIFINISHSHINLLPWLFVCQLIDIDPRIAEVLFSLLLCSLRCVQVIHIMAWLSYSIVCMLHYLITIIMYTWTYKIPVRYILLSVCLRLSLFMQSSFIKYMRMCIFNLPIYLLIVVEIFLLHHEIVNDFRQPLGFLYMASIVVC